MSESDRTPGNLNRSHVPPLVPRASTIAYETPGASVCSGRRRRYGRGRPHDQDVYMGRSRAHRAPYRSHHRPFRIIRFLPNEHGCLDPRIPGAAPRLGECARNCLPPPGPAGANPVERHVGFHADDRRVRRRPQRGLPARRPGVGRGLPTPSATPGTAARAPGGRASLLSPRPRSRGRATPGPSARSSRPWARPGTRPSTG